MPECIHIVSHASKLTYISSVCQLNSLGNCNHNRCFFIQKIFYFCKEFLNIKRHFRQIDQIRSVAVLGFCQCCGTCKPSGITSHDLHDRNHIFLISKSQCIADHFFCGCADIFCSTSESGCMVCQRQVIVDCFRNTKELLSLSCENRIIRQFLDRIHGIISTNVDKRINIQFI